MWPTTISGVLKIVKLVDFEIHQKINKEGYFKFRKKFPLNLFFIKPNAIISKTPIFEIFYTNNSSNQITLFVIIILFYKIFIFIWNFKISVISVWLQLVAKNIDNIIVDCLFLYFVYENLIKLVSYNINLLSSYRGSISSMIIIWLGLPF